MNKGGLAAEYFFIYTPWFHQCFCFLPWKLNKAFSESIIAISLCGGNSFLCFCLETWSNWPSRFAPRQKRILLWRCPLQSGVYTNQNYRARTRNSRQIRRRIDQSPSAFLLSNVICLFDCLISSMSLLPWSICWWIVKEDLDLTCLESRLFFVPCPSCRLSSMW